MTITQTPTRSIGASGKNRKRKKKFHKLQFKLNYQGSVYGNYRTKNVFARKMEFKAWQENPKNEKNLDALIEQEKNKTREAFKKTPATPFDGDAFRKLYQKATGIFKKSNQSVVKDTIDRIVSELANESSKNWYLNAYSSFNSYYKSLDKETDTITFEVINKPLLFKWEEWCREPHMLQVKKFANKAKDEIKYVDVTYTCGNRGIRNYANAMWAAFISAKDNGEYLGEIPFGEGKYLPPPEDEFKQTISKEDVERLKNYAHELDDRRHELHQQKTFDINLLKHLSAKRKAINVALFAYNANGANPADLFRFKITEFKNTVDGLILPYKRKKTNTMRTRKRRTNKLSTGSDILAELIMPYCVEYMNSDGYLLGYLFDNEVIRKDGTSEMYDEETTVLKKGDIIRPISEQKKRNRILFCKKAVNKQLKLVAKELQIGDGKLTLQMMRPTLLNVVIDLYEDEEDGKKAASAVAAHTELETINRYALARHKTKKVVKTLWQVSGEQPDEGLREDIMAIVESFREREKKKKKTG